MDRCLKVNNPKNTNLIKLSVSFFSFLFITTFISGLVATNISNTFADSSATASVSVSASCNMSSTTDTAHTAIVNPNTNQTDIGKTSMTVTCNDSSGYAIYAVGFSGDPSTIGNNTLIGPSSQTIATGTATSGDNSNWSMKLAPGTASSASPSEAASIVTTPVNYTNYANVPDTYTKVASFPSATTGLNGSSFTTTYQAFISRNQSAGDYNGKVKYILVHPNSFIAGTYDINFLANGGSGTMASQTNLENYEDQTLSALSTGSITAPSGYHFAGWCTVQDQTQNPQTTCTGDGAVSYTDAGTVLASTTTASGTSTPASLDLYAYWAPANYTITLNQNGANTSSIPTSLSATYGSSTLSSSITNPSRIFSISGFSTAYNHAEGATVSSNLPVPATYTFNGWYNTDASTGGTEIITTAGALTPSNGWTDANSNWTALEDKTVYARWTGGTATLPTITKTGHTCGWSTSNNTDIITYESGGTITPTENTTLYGVCNANTYSLTINFAGSGVDNVQIRTESGTGGTSMGTVSTSGGSVSGLTYDTAYYLYPSYTEGYELDNWAKTSGEGTLSSTSDANPTFTMGAGDGTVTITGKSSCQSSLSGSMQDFDPSKLCSGVTSGTLTDSRGNTTQSYTVAKLADNKWWMTENLNLAGGTALSSADTNVTDAYISSFSTSNNLTKSGNTIVLPASSTSGFKTNNYSYVYNSGRKTPCTSPGCYSYYSWDAATLGSGRSISTDNTDAPYSICPKNWRLPTSRTTSATNWQTTSDFYVLAHQYGLDSTTSTSESDSDFYNQAGPGTTPNFLPAGNYVSGSFSGGGSSGRYWSSTSYSAASGARFLRFDIYYVTTDDGGGRYPGYSVRCLFSG